MAEQSVAEPYRSLTLPSASKCIRVLDIIAASTDTADIVGNLRVVDLTTSPSFTALSYVWSSPEPDQTIACNGVDIGVSANGYSALRHLRTSLGSFTIWIDGICIDQANTKEKEHQILLMGDIYSQAANVYVWLGEGNEKSDRAMNHMKTAGFLDYFQVGRSNVGITKVGYWRPFLAACSATIARWSLTRHPFVFHSESVDSTLVSQLTYAGSVGSWRGPLGPLVLRLCGREAKYTTQSDILHLLRRNWILRIWTYQEILLAASPIVVCGSAHICWDRFAISLAFLDAECPPLGSCIRPWKSAALSRQQMDPGCISPKPARDCSLEIYTEYSDRMCRFHHLIDLIFVGLSTTSFFVPAYYAFYALSQPTSPSSTGSNVVWAVSWTCSFIIGITIFRLYLARPHTGYASLRNNKRRFNIDQLIDGAYTRDAKVAKDMAFGLWAILQRRTRLPLPQLNYEEPKESIYVAFSRLLVQITGSPHLVLIAAMNNMKGQPSWAPDWTPNGKRECHWGDIERLVRSNYVEGDMDQESLGEICISMMGERAIAVRGRRRGVVGATFAFHKTQSSYQQVEFRKHIYNLRKLVQLLEAMNMVLPEFEVVGTRSQYGLWKRFIHLHRRKDVPALFALLRDASYGETPDVAAMGDNALLKTHISVCNSLAEQERILFQDSYSAPVSQARVGECRRSVKVGDLIIQCPGVAIPIIVRPCSDGSEGVRIKSIAFYSYRLLRSKPSVGNLRLRSRTLPHRETELEEFHVY